MGEAAKLECGGDSFLCVTLPKLKDGLIIANYSLSMPRWIAVVVLVETPLDEPALETVGEDSNNVEMGLLIFPLHLHESCHHFRFWLLGTRSES